jgi:ABC-type branched-subunit amino acid transport system ATPase component
MDAASTQTRPALSIEHIAVHFGGLVAISDMNFVVNEGEVVSLIGPNGAGKTTAFNVITGFLRPSEGEIRYRGNVPDQSEAARGDLAWPGANFSAHQRVPERQRV